MSRSMFTGPHRAYLQAALDEAIACESDRQQDSYLSALLAVDEDANDPKLRYWPKAQRAKELAHRQRSGRAFLRRTHRGTSRDPALAQELSSRAVSQYIPYVGLRAKLTAPSGKRVASVWFSAEWHSHVKGRGGLYVSGWNEFFAHIEAYDSTNRQVYHTLIPAAHAALIELTLAAVVRWRDSRRKGR